jgi:hypothetical protein
MGDGKRYSGWEKEVGDAGGMMSGGRRDDGGGMRDDECGMMSGARSDVEL